MPYGWAAAAAAVGGALIEGNASKSAANTQSQADIAAQQTQLQMFNTIQGNEKPFINAGQGATSQLNKLFGGYFNTGYGNFNNHPTLNNAPTLGNTPTLGNIQGFSFDPRNLSQMPGYQFQLQQGDRALQSNDAASVGALSGTALKDLMGFNQGLAGTYENQYFNQALQGQQQNYAQTVGAEQQRYSQALGSEAQRYSQYLGTEGQQYNQALSNYQTNQGNYYTNQQNIFNRLSQIASLGQNAAGNLGSQGASLGTGIAQAQAAQGAATAAGTVGAANAYAGAASTIPLYALMANGGGYGGGYSYGGTPGAAGNVPYG